MDRANITFTFTCEFNIKKKSTFLIQIYLSISHGYQNRQPVPVAARSKA